MDSCSSRIKEAMKASHLTQSELVQRTGINKGALSSYLSGRYNPKQKSIYILAKALNVSESWLMGYDVPKEREVPTKVAEDTRETSPMAIKVGNQLIDLEHRYGYSEQFVADEMGIPLDQYHDLKSGINHILDPNLMCKFAAFYNKKWTDFFSFDGEPIPANDNIVALQEMAGLTDAEVCNAVGITSNDYDLIRMGSKQPDYSTLEKFCNLYNMPFAMLLGANLMQHADDPKKKLSVKIQLYINELFDALEGEDFDKNDMQDVVDYVNLIAKKKKRNREREEK